MKKMIFILFVLTVVLKKIQITDKEELSDLFKV